MRRRHALEPLLAGLAACTLSASGQTSSIPAGFANAYPTEPITPIPPPPEADPAKVALGEALFADPQLSSGGLVSCLSCHDVGSNGASARVFDTGPGERPLLVNTITVFNAALSYRLTWSAGTETLEEQAAESIANRSFMDSSMPEVVGRLNADPATRVRFQTAYGHGPNQVNLLDAIATYERSLLTPDSHFDRWLRGQASAITIQEREGYEYFKLFGCVSCHQGVNVGGNLKQRVGVFRQLTERQSPAPLRVPSLQSIATTAPYFDDGSAPTLRVAVSRMASAQLDRRLSEEQLDAVVAFLQTLTAYYKGKAVTAPPRQ